MATFIQLGDHLRKDPRRRPQRATATTEFRAALAEFSLAQTRLPQWFDVTPRHVRRWEDGSRHLPHAVDIVLRLLAARMVTVAQIEQVTTARDRTELRPPAPLEESPVAMTPV